MAGLKPDKIPLDKNCFVTSITLAFLAKFGLDSINWDPLIVRDAFEGGLLFGKMPQRMFDKLNCGLSLIGTDLYNASIEGFLTFTAVMNNNVLDAEYAPFVSLKECAWGVWEFMNLNGDMDNTTRPSVKFSPAIIKYIQESGRLNGVTAMPVWLDFAQPKDESMPDMSDDVDLFNQYQQRQEEYKEAMNAYVTDRQARLADELNKLKNDGFLAK